MTSLKCPYCSDPHHFQVALSERTGEYEKGRGGIAKSARCFRNPHPRIFLVLPEYICGKYRLLSLTDDLFKKPWRGFTVEILGMDFEEEPPKPWPQFHKEWNPPGPFFAVYEERVGTEKSAGGGYRTDSGVVSRWRLFNACRVTHSRSDLEVVVHWWPDHSQIITVSGFPLEVSTKTDFDLLERALALFRTSETRGRPPRITEKSLRDALAKLPRNASNKHLAAELEVRERALEVFAKERGLTIKQVRSKYSNPKK